MSDLLRQSTAVTKIVGLVLDADGVAVTTCVIGDFKLTKGSAATAAFDAAATSAHRHTGHYGISMTVDDTDTVDSLTITLDKTTDAMQPARFRVIEEAWFDELYGAGGAPLDETDINAQCDQALVDVGLTTTVTGRIDTPLSSIDAKATDILADTGTDGVKLASDALDSILVESGISAGAGLTNDTGTQLTAINARQALALLAAAIDGVLAGAGTTTITIKPAGLPGGNTRITATVDEDGNRSALTLKVPD